MQSLDYSINNRPTWSPSTCSTQHCFVNFVLNKIYCIVLYSSIHIAVYILYSGVYKGILMILSS